MKIKVLNSYTALKEGASIWFVPQNSPWIKVVSWYLGGGLLKKTHDTSKNKPTNIIHLSSTPSVLLVVIYNSKEFEHIKSIWKNLDPNNSKSVRLFNPNKSIEKLETFFQDQCEKVSVVETAPLDNLEQH